MLCACGDIDQCNRKGLKFAQRAWDQEFVPYHEAAVEGTSLLNEGDSRRPLLLKTVGGCPLCVQADRDALVDTLVRDVCCMDHRTEIGRWITEHRKRQQRETQLCRKHRAGATEAWVLMRTDNWVDAPVFGLIDFGHVAFAFKRTTTEFDHWVPEHVWVCGSSDGVIGGEEAEGPARYWWTAQAHPLDEDHFHAGYEFAKRLRIDRGHWLEALIEADAQYCKDYKLFGNNCIDVVRKVLVAYGLELPAPTDGLVPLTALDWWHGLPGELVDLKRMRRRRRR